MTDPQRTAWRDVALCKGSPLPWTRTETAAYRELLVMVAVCERCPSLEPCREDMRAHQDYVGVRAGVAWTQPGGSKPQPSARRIEQRVCAWCDQPYEKPPEVRWTKYCSEVCRYKGKRLLDNASQRRRNAREINSHNGVNTRSEIGSAPENGSEPGVRQHPGSWPTTPNSQGVVNMVIEPRPAVDVHSGGET